MVFKGAARSNRRSQCRAGVALLSDNLGTRWREVDAKLTHSPSNDCRWEESSCTRTKMRQSSAVQINMIKCSSRRTLHEELVAKQPHSGLIQDGVLRQLNGFEKRYTCTLCATRWRRFMPDRTRGAKKYFWMSRDA